MDRPLNVGLSLAGTLIALNALCALIVALWPDEALSIANSFAHGLDLRAIKSSEPLGFQKFLLGAVSIGAIGFVSGAVYAALNKLFRQ